jgi:hypothetical protein
MGGESFTKQFILKHYYDIMDDSGVYSGIYVCENCLNHQKWDGALSDFARCDNCDGSMRLCVVKKSELDNIIERLIEEQAKIRTQSS